ncbi:MAG: hypothetical protein IPJ03_17360 [Ignavibacteriales bacterium]|nr:hypothetical protein [Ignavibacteriales bacterium]
MINYNTKSFFTQYVKQFGKFNEQQKDGLKFLLNKLSLSKRIPLLRMRAYVLATVRFETAYTYEPITEYGSEKYLKSKPYYPYIGRGYIQLSWKSNYEKFGGALNIDLVGNPKLANEPETAWKILEMGMTDNFGVQDPDFTNYTLEDFFKRYQQFQDFYRARKIINPKDYDSYEPIAQMAEGFVKCLSASEIEEANNSAAPRGLEEVKWNITK